MQSKVRNAFDLSQTPCHLQSRSDLVLCAQRREAWDTGIPLHHLSLSSFFLYFWILPMEQMFWCLPCFVCLEPVNWGGKKGRGFNCVTERGHLLPINCLFIRHSYHLNWIYKQHVLEWTDIIARHNLVCYTNGAHFRINMKWHSLYSFSFNAFNNLYVRVRLTFLQPCWRKCIPQR